MNCELEVKNRVEFIKNLVESAHVKGIVFGNSGGKDSALVGILCKMACDNTLGVIMPCSVSRNFTEDAVDGAALAEKFGIESRTIDLSAVREAEVKALEDAGIVLNESAITNIAPRIRMMTLYAIAAAEGRLVAGTGNRDEMYVGYFTKWGDGAHDFNPISDLTVAEIYELLEYLDCPENIIKKAPSAALAEGQTDEGEMGVTYAQLDHYILTGEIDDEKAKARIDQLHRGSAHKRTGITRYRYLDEQSK